MADNGGWTPGDLKAEVGQPLHLRLTSDDVVHGFAVGQSAIPAVDVLPGQWTTTTLVFDQPRQVHVLLHALVRAESLAHARHDRGDGRCDRHDDDYSAVVRDAESRSRRAASE